MKKFKLSFLIFCCILFNNISSAQFFNLESSFVSSEGQAYRYLIKGVEDFPDSAVFHIELINESSEIIYSDSSNVSISTQKFTLNSSENLFEYNIGLFDLNNYTVRVWISLGEEILNEMYLKEN